MPVQPLRRCFNDGQLDLNFEHCHLLPGFRLVPQPNPNFKRLHKLDDAGPPPSWNFAFALDTPRYRYKTTRDARDCESPEAYSGTLQFVFKHNDLPLKLCSQAEDAVKQRSSPRKDLLEANAD